MRKKLLLAIGLLYLLAVCALIFEVYRPYRRENPLDAAIDQFVDRERFIDESSYDEEIANLTYIDLPADEDLSERLYISKDRAAYESGAMRLIVPALDLDALVSDGVTKQALKTTPGLFEFSSLPGESGQNVSIAGHRSWGMFLNLDKLKEGDLVYLVYDGHMFTYGFFDVKDVPPSDWTIITDQGFSCLTLVTCTPVREATKRMVVRAELVSVEEIEEDENATQIARISAP